MENPRLNLENREENNTLEKYCQCAEAILTFSTAPGTVRGEQVLINAGIHAKAVPLPEGLRAGCGQCLHVPAHRIGDSWEVLKSHSIVPESSYLAGTLKPLPPPVFTRALALKPGNVVSIVGCGGKTSLLHRLSMENRILPVLLSTTTRILRPPEHVVDRRLKADHSVLPGVNLIAPPDGQKLAGVDPDVLANRMPTDGFTFLEADGSRGLPLKGWEDYEPVILKRTTVTVGVCTLWPVGLACGPTLVHRPERFHELSGASDGDVLTLEHIAAMLSGRCGMFRKARGRRVLLINQTESDRDRQRARQLAELLPPQLCAVFACSLRHADIERIGAGESCSR